MKKRILLHWILGGIVSLLIFQSDLWGQDTGSTVTTSDHKTLLKNASDHLSNAPDKTLEITLKILEDQDSRLDSASLSKAFMLSGEAYYKLKKFNQAEDMYKRAFSMFNKLDTKEQMATALNNLATTYKEQGLFQKSKRHFQMAKTAYKDIDDNLNLAKVYYSLGSLEKQYGDMWAAHEYYQFSLDISENIKNLELVLLNCKTKADLYAKFNYFKSAYAYFSKWTALKDSIRASDHKSEISGLQSQYNEKVTELKDTEIKHKKELEDASVNKIKLYRNVGIVCAILIAIILILLITIMQIKRSSKKILTDKNIQIDEQNNRLNKVNEAYKQMNKELRLIEKALKETNQARERLINVIAHDISTSINTLKKNNEKQKYNYEVLSESEKKSLIKTNNLILNNIYGLIDNILLWANVQSGKLRFKGKLANIKPIMDTALNSYTEGFEARDIQVRNEILNNQDAFYDPFLLETIVRNIMSFLSKYNIDGSVICISAFERIKYLEICIENIGQGKLPENLNQLFSREKKTIDSTKMKESEIFDGMLELQISKQFIELSGGNIWVTSLPGAGNKFCFTLQKSGPAYLHTQNTAYNRLSSSTA